MSESLRIMTGPCQTHDKSQVDYLLDLASMKVTQGGQLVPAIDGVRLCTIKSRTNCESANTGGGIDVPNWNAAHQQMRIAIRNGKPIGELPKTAARPWVERIAETGVKIGFECMDEIHAQLFSGIMPAYLGLCWTPSVSSLGPIAKSIAENVADHTWSMGIKNPKFPWIIDADHPDKATDHEKTWAGLMSYVLAVQGVANIPEVILIQRGVMDRDPKQPGEKPWRNYPSHKSTVITTQLVEAQLQKIPANIRPKLVVAYDPSHSNGPERRDNIVADSIAVAQLTNREVMGPNAINPDGHVYTMLLVESCGKTVAQPLSDRGQHISGEDVQTIVDAIAKQRPIQAR